MFKRIFLTFALLLGIIALTEFLDLTGVNQYHPRLEAAFVNNEYILNWPKLPFWNYYAVEVFKSPPHTTQNDSQQTSQNQPLLVYRTWDNQLTIDQNFPYRTYWRVSAQGLFKHPLGSYSNPLSLADVLGYSAAELQKSKPEIISTSTREAPASDKPFLTWAVITGAVYYEVEFLSQPPENPNDITASLFRVFCTQAVYTNGYNANLSKYADNSIYWRVRALDYDGNPIGVFSNAQQLFIDHRQQVVLKPLLNCWFNDNDQPAPLYPVYHWIPITGATRYEVEVLNHLPENPNGVTPSIFRIWSASAMGFDCYDEVARNVPGVYYWRVRGLDQNGRPVGVYSDVGQFTVDLKKGNFAATFGDSITHGGGAISYSPSNLEYDFQTYLSFPVVNLGKSGDTAETMVERFDHDVLPYQPRYLIILGGTNSLRGGTPASEVIAQLAAIRDKCLAHGIRPIFLTLPPINPANIKRAFAEDTTPYWRAEFDAVNAFIKNQRYYIDIDPQLSDANRELPDYYAIDGLHPDIEGKKMMAQVINANWLRVTR